MQQNRDPYSTSGERPLRQPSRQQQPSRAQPPPRQQRPAAAGRSSTAGPQPSRRPQSGAARTGQQQRRQPPPQQRRSEELRQKKPRNRWFRATIMVLATLAGCIFLSFFILQSAWDLLGLNQEDKEINIKVPANSDILSVSELLAETGVVDQPFTFRIYAGWKLEDEEIKPGDYIFNSNMGYDQIIVALRSGITEIQEVTVTLIEGWTLSEIAKALEDNKVCDADEFLEYLETADLNYEFMDRLPDNSLRFRRLEGYVFPDTYNFYVNEAVEKVAAKFLNNFDRKITEDMENRMSQLGLTLDETIVLASIIQKEAGDEDHMRRVSAVFHNRLNRSDLYPNLQSDVTIFYVENIIKKNIGTQNQEMYDSYNTYVAEGLPVGAICNPGLEAIEAALYPADSNNFFFVTDSEGIYYYAATAEKHYENVRQAEENGDRDSIHGTNTRQD